MHYKVSVNIDLGVDNIVQLILITILYIHDLVWLASLGLTIEAGI